MKCKRILSMLLTLCMVMSLFAGTTVTVSATDGPGTNTEYTLDTTKIWEPDSIDDTLTLTAAGIPAGATVTWKIYDNGDGTKGVVFSDKTGVQDGTDGQGDYSSKAGTLSAGTSTMKFKLDCLGWAVIKCMYKENGGKEKDKGQCNVYAGHMIVVGSNDQAPQCVFSFETPYHSPSLESLASCGVNITVPDGMTLTGWTANGQEYKRCRDQNYSRRG